MNIRLKEKILPLLPSSVQSYILSLLKSDINRRIAKGSFWLLFGVILSKGLLLLSSVIIARILGADVYGQVGIIKSTINMFTAFAGMGLGLTATKYIAEYKNKDGDKVRNIIALSNGVAFVSGLLFSIIIIIFSSEIAVQINAPNLKREIQIGGIMLFFSALNGVQSGILAGCEDFKSIAKNSFIAGVISFFIQIIATYLWGLIGAIAGFGSNFLFLWLLNKYSIKKIISINSKINIWNKNILNELHILWKFSLPAVLSGIMTSSIIWICNAVLVNQQGGYTQMALFDIANQWRITVLFIPVTLSQIILPMLSSSLDNQISYKNIFFKNLKLISIISLIISVVVILMVPIITLFYGKKYDGMQLPLIIMVISTVLVAINNAIGQLMTSREKMWMSFAINSLWAIVLMSAVYIIVYLYEGGAIGLSVSYLIAYCTHTIIQFLYLINFFRKNNNCL